MLSNRKAKALKYIPKEEHESNFFQLVNNVFDVLNSRIPRDKKAHLKSSYGLNVRSQENTLKRLLEVISDVRVGTRKALLPFQKGFNISVNSLLELFDDMKNVHDVTYLLTARLNQDFLENYFVV